MSYSVYIHTNRVNGKRYVGVTTMKPELRWGSNGRKYKNNKHFYSAIQKYGWDNFYHFILEVDTKEKMYELEKQYIDYYDTTNPEKGYNRSIGGDAGCYKGKNYGTVDYVKEYNRQYYQLHKDRLKEESQKYRQSHRKELCEKQKDYYLSHKEEKRTYDKEYWIKNREKRLKQHKEWEKNRLT